MIVPPINRIVRTITFSLILANTAFIFTIQSQAAESSHTSFQLEPIYQKLTSNIQEKVTSLETTDLDHQDVQVDVGSEQLSVESSPIGPLTKDYSPKRFSYLTQTTSFIGVVWSLGYCLGSASYWGLAIANQTLCLENQGLNLIKGYSVCPLPDPCSAQFLAEHHLPVDTNYCQNKETSDIMFYSALVFWGVAFLSFLSDKISHSNYFKNN